MLKKTQYVVMGLLLVGGSLLPGCDNGSATGQDSTISQEAAVPTLPDYDAVIYPDATDMVNQRLFESISAADELGLVAEASIVVDDSNRQVAIDAVILTDSVEIACAKAEAVARIFAEYAVVTNADGIEVVDEEGLGALWEVYDLIIKVDNPDGTLDLDGYKAASNDEVNWQ